MNDKTKITKYFNLFVAKYLSDNHIHKQYVPDNHINAVGNDNYVLTPRELMS